jgi:ankyrin repeat protein
MHLYRASVLPTAVICVISIGALACERKHGSTADRPAVAAFNVSRDEMNGLLLNAAESGQLAGVRGLLQRGASPDAFEAGTHDGDTALLVACRRNDVALARVLLDAGANPNLRQHGNWADFPPLTICAAEGRDEIVQLLLEHGARVNVRVGPVYPSHTPLVGASDGGYVGSVKLLLANGAIVDRSALQAAISRGHLQVVSDLLAAGGDPRWILESGRTVMEEASRSPENVRAQMMVTVCRFMGEPARCGK